MSYTDEIKQGLGNESEGNMERWAEIQDVSATITQTAL